MNFVLRQSDDPAFSWDRGLIVGLHDRVLAGRYDHGAGSEQVEALMDEASERMRTGHPHSAIAAAWIHVVIAAIHPFKDGNGRSARILASLAMYRGGFKRREFTSLEEWWGRRLHDYYELFGCLGPGFDRRADVTPFVKGHLQAQLHQVRALDLRLRAEQQIWMAVEEAAEDAGLDRRLANALWDTFFGRDVTAGYYRSLADVSPATATNDLTAAVASRLLTARGQRRGRRYLAGDRLYEAVAGALSIDIESAGSAKDRIVTELGRRLMMSGEAFGFQRRPFAEE
jgi:Fic family protein